jgi:hypothetical protein
MRKYAVLETRAINGKVCAEKGDIVYSIKGYDYGLANDDTRAFGYKHISVTLDKDGDYPSFTIPQHHLRELHDDV